MTAMPSENDLRSMIDEGLTLYQISRKFNTTIKEVFKLGRSYGIHFAYDHNHIPKPTKQDLESMYSDEGMLQRQIGKEFDVHGRTVCNWLSIFNISTVGRKGGTVMIPPKKVLIRMYTDEHMTQEQIGEEFGVTQSSVHIWFRNYNIQARGPSGTLADPIPPKYDLLNCINNGLNQYQLAKKYNVCDGTIFKWCKKLDIPGMVNNFRCTTPQHMEWRDAVFERDDYTCQECGGFGDVLHAHHIRPYRDYPELELDIDNGITLCERCHYATRGCEHLYLVKYEDIVLRDRGIGNTEHHSIIESIPCEPMLQPNSILDYPQEVLA